jgi:hypothetical protein
MDHRVIGVLGASGGLGASTLAVALGVCAARRSGLTACVDGQLWGGGLDVTACLEHLPGLRWPDLTEAAGELDGAALLRELPSQDGIAVLAAGGPLVAGGAASSALVRDDRVADVVAGPELAVRAVQALGRLCAVTVVDLGRGADPPRGAALVDACTDLVLLAGTSARRLADGVVAAHRITGLAQLASVGLVLRTPRRDALEPEEVATRLDLPLVAALADDPRVGVDADRARMPGTRQASGLTRVADRILEWLALADETSLGVGA